MKQFIEDSKSKRAVVFCIKCGSKAVYYEATPQGSMRLRCFNCNNDMLWDLDKFGISRIVGDEMSLLDFEMALNKKRR